MDPVGPRTAFPFRAPIRVRFSEADGQGVVVPAAFFGSAEATRHAYWLLPGDLAVGDGPNGCTVVEVPPPSRAPAGFYQARDVAVRMASLEPPPGGVVEFLVTPGARPKRSRRVGVHPCDPEPAGAAAAPIPEFFRRAVLDFEGPHVQARPPA